MYTPAFARNEERGELLRFMRAHSFATVVTPAAGPPFVTHLPLVIDEGADGLRITGHFARANPHWQALAGHESLAVFQGPHAYVSPRLYDTPQSVPTWNYVAVHATGRARALDHAAEALRAVEALIAATEPAYAEQWRSLPERYREGMLRGIVAFELVVERLEGKYKLSQNRSLPEQRRVAEALAAGDDAAARATGDIMRLRLRTADERTPVE